ncbi:MAG: helix-turn-helix domain-containing protein [Candidatus Paceibacterota bacterium]
MYSTQEIANILHLSRIEVFRKIKAGKIKAEKVGRNYVIPYESVEEILGETIGTYKKEEIEKVINRAMKEYGETFKRLSKE